MRTSGLASNPSTDEQGKPLFFPGPVSAAIIGRDEIIFEVPSVSYPAESTFHHLPSLTHVGHSRNLKRTTVEQLTLHRRVN